MSPAKPDRHRIRNAQPTEIKACTSCGGAIIEVANGWVHIRVGWVVSYARFCNQDAEAKPIASPKGDAR